MDDDTEFVQRWMDAGKRLGDLPRRSYRRITRTLLMPRVPVEACSCGDCTWNAGRSDHLGH